MRRLHKNRKQKFQVKNLLNQYLAQESYERILHAIQKLDEIYRVVFEYKYLHELSDREIADLLGVTPKVVNVRIFRARKKLQNLLREECGSNEQTKIRTEQIKSHMFIKKAEKCVSRTKY